MKRLFLRMLGVFALSFCIAACAYGSEEKDLFQKDLSDAVCKKPVWSFNEKGELSSTVDEILWTKDEYENFCLTLEFKFTKAGNGGIIVYNTEDDWIPTSIEIQIGDYDYWLKQFGPRGTCGAIFGFQGVAKDFTKGIDSWNKLMLICKGKSIKVYINGELANDFDMSKFTDKDKNPDGSEPFKWLKAKARAEVATKGRIGFQGHHGNGDTMYRNINISPLMR